MTAVPVSACRPNPWNRKRKVDPDLVHSMEVCGLLQPIVVRPVGNHYQIIAGERRWSAAKELGWETIPAQVREVDDLTARELCLVENVMRENLTPIEEAKEIAVLLELHRDDAAEVAARLGRSRHFIRARAKLAKLDLEMLDEADIDVNSLPVACQELLAKIPSSVAQAVVQENPWAVRDIYRLQSAVQGLTRSIEGAPWAADDADLLPKAGACLACHKRTGADPDLFGEVRATVDDGDFCLDRDCYRAKELAVVEAVAAKESLAGRTVVLVARDIPAEHYDAAKARRVALLDALFRSEYESCRRTDPSAVRGVIWCGEGAGTAVWCRKVAKPEDAETVEVRRLRWMAEQVRKHIRSLLTGIDETDAESISAAAEVIGLDFNELEERALLEVPE